MDDAFRILDGDELERLLATDQPAHRTCCGETGAHHSSCPVVLWTPAYDPGTALDFCGGCTTTVGVLETGLCAKCDAAFTQELR